jgi:acetyl esterase
MEWFWDQYAPGPDDRLKPCATPLNVADLSVFPTSCVFTAEFDPLRDEGNLFAERLRGAGVRVAHICFERLIHGFFRLKPDAPWVKRIIDVAAAEIEGALSRHDGGVR